MLRVLTYIFITAMLISCSKSSDVQTPSGTGGGTGSGGTGVTPDVGSILIDNSYDTLKIIDANTGAVTKTMRIDGLQSVEPATIDEGIYYHFTGGVFTATDLSTGAQVFAKGYSGLYFSGYKPWCFPVIKDTIVYIVNHSTGDQLVNLYAYHKKTGLKYFQSNISFGHADLEPILTTPLVSKDNVYVIYSSNGSTYPTSVFCFNRFSGALRWSRTLTGQGNANPYLLLNNNELIVSTCKTYGGYESVINSLDTATGNTNWQNTYSSGELIDADKKFRNNTILSVSDPGRSQHHFSVNYINPANGQVTSSYDFGAFGIFNVNNDAVYYTNRAQLTCYSLDLKSFKWTVELASETYRKSLANSANYMANVTTPLVTDLYVYTLEEVTTFGSGARVKAFVAVYDKTTGKKLVETPLGSTFGLTKFIVRDKNNNYFFTQRRDQGIY